MRVDRRLAVVDDLVGLELLESRLLGLAEKSHADPDEGLAYLRFFVSETGFTGAEFLNRACDGVVNLGIVLREPHAEIVVVLVFEARDDARPIEARGLVVALLRVGQVELRFDRAVRDLRLWEFSGGHGERGYQTDQ